jgi:hypothetical protein
MAQARVGVGEGQATSVTAQAAKAIALWYQAEMKLQHQTLHQTLHRSVRPDDRAGVRGVAP